MDMVNQVFQVNQNRSDYPISPLIVPTLGSHVDRRPPCYSGLVRKRKGFLHPERHDRSTVV